VEEGDRIGAATSLKTQVIALPVTATLRSAS
jgi:hypothetical protein